MRRHHGANLVVISVAGASNMTGPSEAAFVVNDLVRPNSVIVTHVDEAATVNGKVVPTSKTAAFQKAVTVPVHVPLSGRQWNSTAAGAAPRIAENPLPSTKSSLRHDPDNTGASKMNGSGFMAKHFGRAGMPRFLFMNRFRSILLAILPMW